MVNILVVDDDPMIICKAPAVFLNLQPTSRLNYDQSTTEEWLAHCGVCPLHEFAYMSSWFAETVWLFGMMLPDNPMRIRPISAL